MAKNLPGHHSDTINTVREMMCCWEDRGMRVRGQPIWITCGVWLTWRAHVDLHRRTHVPLPSVGPASLLDSARWHLRSRPGPLALGAQSELRTLSQHSGEPYVNSWMNGPLFIYSQVSNYRHSLWPTQISLSISWNLCSTPQPPLNPKTKAGLAMVAFVGRRSSLESTLIS